MKNKNTVYNHVVIWQSADIKHYLDNIKDTNYSVDPTPKDNAMNVCRLIMAGLPGNTMDIILDKIESEFKMILSNPDNAKLMLEKHYVSSVIRSVLNEIGKIDEF